MSVTLGRKIGEGACAIVYEYGDSKVIKLFRSNSDKSAVMKEFRYSFYYNRKE